MRTALVLLFLLALAALPGALLPQRSLNQQLVDQYFTDHPTLAPALDAVGAFDVFAAPWFAAVYLLLMVSLIGCVLPRTRDDATQLRARPVAVPRNLARLPHHATGTLDADLDAATAAVRSQLRGWRIAERTEDGHRTISAEKGYLREVGNLVFHLSLVGLLVGFAAGKLFGYEGQVIVPDRGGQFCNTGILGYDTFRAGTLVDGTDLAPFCVRVDDVTADYLPTGQAETFATALGHQTSADLAAGRVDEWRSFRSAPTTPCAPTACACTCSATATRRVHRDVPERGAAHRRRPVAPGRHHHAAVRGRHEVRATRRHRRRAAAGEPARDHRAAGPHHVRRRRRHLDLPRAARPRGGRRRAARRPGLDDGRGQSIFEVDRAGRRGELGARRPGEPGARQTTTLDAAPSIRFDGVRDWVNLQVSHDPAQAGCSCFESPCSAAGASLAVRRRRFWPASPPPTGPAPPRGARRPAPHRPRRATARSSTGSPRPATRPREDGRADARRLERPLFMGAIVVYVLAIVLHAVELAALRSARSPPGRAAAPVEEPRRSGPRGERYGRMAVR
jgi:cytochrome c biogenesis protein